MVKSANPAPPKSFEAALAELESLVQTMESGKLALEESLTAYQRGAELLKFCQSRLDDADQRIRVLEAGVLKEFPATEGLED
ncbi:MAG: exodeoxyribonuclease VII small subunit [Rhodocyclaceae bacterium]|jgi:exodeoxyribonuclease VII small subunit